MSILFGALVGAAYAIAPGPVNITTMRRTLISGVLSGVVLQLGALVGGLPYAMLTSVGVGQFASRPPIHVALGLTGATVLLVLGWSSVRDERRFIEWEAMGLAQLRSGRGDQATIAAAPAVKSVSRNRALTSPTQRSFLTGALLSISNPLAIAFWLALDGVMMQPPHLNPIVFLTGFYLSQLGWAVLLPLLLGWRQGWLNNRLLHTLSLVCGLAQIGFGLHAGYAALLG